MMVLTYHNVPSGGFLVASVHVQITSTYPRNMDLENSICIINDNRLWLLLHHDVKRSFVYYCLHDFSSQVKYTQDSI